MRPVEAESDPEDQRAFEAALGALRRRERTVAELADWLREKGWAEPSVQRAVGRLVECGELDDERFAAQYADDKRRLSGWGPDRIAAALRERGLAGELIERACLEERERQLERAEAMLRERGVALEDDRARARALGLLTRRGFDYELAYEVIGRFEPA